MSISIPGQLFATMDIAHVADEAAVRIGRALRQAIAKRGKATLALSGGNTPRPAYEKLAREPAVDWTNVEVFWIDERAVPTTSDRSNYRLAQESLLSKVAVPEANVHRMKAEAPDLEAAARDYEDLLRKHLAAEDGAVPSFDVAVLGVGDDGHTASLFPGGGLVAEKERLVVAVPEAPELKREARLTVTTPVIQNIGVAFVLAVGAGKREALRRAWSDEGSDEETPSRIYRASTGSLTWIIDKAAGGLG